jgi:hypothetical protein
MAYATLAEVRALEGLDDTTLYPDANLTEGIAWAEEVIDNYCGTSFTYKAFSVTLTGNSADTIRLVDDDGATVLFPRTIATVTVDGVAETPTAWALYPEGIVARDEGVFTYTKPGRNVVITGTAGVTSTAPAQIAWACRTLARYYALSLHNRVDDRALQIQNDFGTVTLAQPGGTPERPTALPEVNAVLNRNRHRAPVAF